MCYPWTVHRPSPARPGLRPTGLLVATLLGTSLGACGAPGREDGPGGVGAAAVESSRRAPEGAPPDPASLPTAPADGGSLPAGPAHGAARGSAGEAEGAGATPGGTEAQRTGPLPESDRATPPDTSWQTAAGPAQLVVGRFEGGRVRVEGVYDTPAVCPGGPFAIVPVEDVGASRPPRSEGKPVGGPPRAGLLYADLATGALRPLLDAGGRPDRPWLDPGCTTLVFAWAPEGLVGLWRLDLPGVRAGHEGAGDEGPGDTKPVALTNVGLVRTPGRVPEGFLPPPRRGGAHLDGATLRWEAEDGRSYQLPSPLRPEAGR